MLSSYLKCELYGSVESILMKRGMLFPILSPSTEHDYALQQALHVFDNCLIDCLSIFGCNNSIQYCVVKSGSGGPFSALLDDNTAVIVFTSSYIYGLYNIARFASCSDILIELLRIGDSPQIYEHSAPDYVRSSLGFPDPCLIIRRPILLSALYICMVVVPFFHEIAHILNGHIQFLKHEPDTLNEVKAALHPRDDTLCTLETLEYDADSFAAVGWLVLVLSGSAVPEELASFLQGGEDAFLLLSVASGLVFLSAEITIVEDSAWPTWVVSHRSSRIRSMSMINTLSTFMNERLGFDLDQSSNVAAESFVAIVRLSRLIFGQNLDSDLGDKLLADATAQIQHIVKIERRWARLRPRLQLYAWRTIGALAQPTQEPI